MLYTSIFPESLKISKMIPFYKVNDQILQSVYKPIALVPSLFEYVLLEQLKKYFVKNNLLSPHQYGFRAKLSTKLTVINMVDNVTYKLDSGLIPINNYLDLSKAFDTQLHDILLDEMSYYGVNGVANDLLRSYLTQSQQIVEFDGFLTKSLEIKTGVPQGSVLVWYGMVIFYLTWCIIL